MKMTMHYQLYKEDVDLTIDDEEVNPPTEKKEFICGILRRFYRYDVIDCINYDGDTYYFEVNDVFGERLKQYFDSDVDKGKVLCFLMV